MKVFIGWSGSKSLRLAEELREWLTMVIQGIEPFLSSKNIRAGVRWRREIATQLDECYVGLLCLTSESLTSSWLMFEAGAVSKHPDRSWVLPILFDVTEPTLDEPLREFTCTSFEKEPMRKLVQDVNGLRKYGGEQPLPEALLDGIFDRFWDELDGKVTAILAEEAPPTPPPRRGVEDMVEELLTLTRQIASRPPSTPERGIPPDAAHYGTVPLPRGFEDWKRERQSLKRAVLSMIEPDEIVNVNVLYERVMGLVPGTTVSDFAEILQILAREGTLEVGRAARGSAAQVSRTPMSTPPDAEPPTPSASAACEPAAGEDDAAES